MCDRVLQQIREQSGHWANQMLDNCQVGRAIDDRNDLCSSSLENGNFSNTSQRRFAKIANSDPTLGAAETGHRAKGAVHAGFIGGCSSKSRETGLDGWRSSANGPLLCPFSLLTGNFTGNFAKSWLLPRQRLQIVAAAQGIRSKFPTQQNRELSQQNREFLRRNREF